MLNNFVFSASTKPNQWACLRTDSVMMQLLGGYLPRWFIVFPVWLAPSDSLNLCCFWEIQTTSIPLISPLFHQRTCTSHPLSSPVDKLDTQCFRWKGGGTLTGSHICPHRVRRSQLYHDEVISSPSPRTDTRTDWSRDRRDSADKRTDRGQLQTEQTEEDWMWRGQTGPQTVQTPVCSVVSVPVCIMRDLVYRCVAVLTLCGRGLCLPHLRKAKQTPALTEVQVQIHFEQPSRQHVMKTR